MSTAVQNLRLNQLFSFGHKHLCVLLQNFYHLSKEIENGVGSEKNASRFLFCSEILFIDEKQNQFLKLFVL